MAKDLEKIRVEQNLSPELRDFVESIYSAKGNISAIESMKRTEGWKILDTKIREELQIRINELVKDDLKIQTLIALLKIADTKSMSKILDKTIEESLPE